MITVEDFKRLEQASVHFGISRAMLMERSGKSFFDYLQKHLDLSGKTTLVFAGHGDNAGDGFVLARLLCKECFVFVFFYGDTKKFSGETAAAFARIQGNDHIDIMRPPQLDSYTLKKIRQTEHLLLIDALFGIGFSGQMGPPFSGAVDLYNTLPGTKISLDTPSGINATTGQASTPFCTSDLTLTLYDKKPGHMGIKNVTVVPLEFAPEAVEQIQRDIAKRGPLR